MPNTVIVLDDTDEIHLITKKVLESIELKVICLKKPDDLIPQILANIHDLSIILLDIYMPEKNGFSVMHSIKDRFPKRKFKIVFFTSIKDKKYIMQGMSLKADGYIIKPFQIEEFKDRITKLINEKSF
ncbi:response regulator [Silvanigrella aquatica]|uniref:Response regulatory domain-containing protein n=1 Tax=Silvanigrella aquatica TaxID=1915309 RepID=A0A1L4D0C8_9BACT|nr:response regulator [Silvanigrella aquatica]APJ03648.1 hypothetical protein AXG55_06900 [Silvanigrella aquatica]